MLQRMGAWMKVNGEGIYGSKAWVKFGEGPLDASGKMALLPTGAVDRKQAEYRFGPGDFRFTVGKDGAVYAWALETPKPGATVKIVSMGTQAGLLGTPVTSVTMLGSNEKLRWKQGADGLEIVCPKTMPEDIAVGFKVR